MQEEREISEDASLMESAEYYEITDCTAILRYLDAVEEKESKGQDYRKFMERIESHINYMMFV
ncbi:MAG: hypothetical protein JWQ14_3540 [Adhaeribacter sp.]|nr:hypothetical protein [Adhaeribacter sp.]